jgi:Spy/CpxP family protein refolding chaperone
MISGVFAPLRVAAAAVVVLAASVSLQGQRPSAKWWQAADVQAELGLTAQQSAQVEEIFQATLPVLRDAKRELDQQEAELSRLIAEGTSDEAAVAQLVDRVESKRGEMSKARTLMLYRMHRVLTPEQRVKLKALHDRERRERRDSGTRRR